MSASPDRRCRHCGEPLARRAGEGIGDWRERKSCNRSCHTAWKNSKPLWQTLSEMTVVLENGCIEWTGYRDKKGYSRLSVGGEVLLHRISFMMHNAADVDGMLVCHRCDNPSCINPSHLFLGTAQDNMDDMKRKGRNAPRYGQENPNWRHGRNCTASPKAAEIREARNG